MKKLIFATISVVAVAVVGIGAYRFGQERPSRQYAESPSTTGRDEPEVPDRSADLAQAIRQLDRRLAALEVRQVQAQIAQPQSAKGPAGPVVPPFDPAVARENERKRAAAIEAAVRSEPRDGTWAPASENQIRGAVAAAINEGKAQFSIKNLKCLTSVCEMVIAAPSAEQVRGSHLELVRRIGEMGSFDIGTPESAVDGTTTVTYRMFRSGYPRPDEGT